MISKNELPGITKIEISNERYEDYEEMNYSNIKLEKGEIICPDCKGKGFFDNPKILERISELDDKLNAKIAFPMSKRYPCMKCKGHRKIDWVENLIGGNEKEEALLPEVRHTLEYVRKSIEQEISTNMINTKESRNIIKSNIINLLNTLKKRTSISDFHVDNYNHSNDILSVDIRCDNTINHIAYKINIGNY